MRRLNLKVLTHLCVDSKAGTTSRSQLADAAAARRVCVDSSLLPVLGVRLVAVYCACRPAENYRITENWAAYIDPTTGEGVGIYTPVAQTITCYRVGKVSHSSALQADQQVTSRWQNLHTIDI
jgi:hypothetical protein